MGVEEHRLFAGDFQLLLGYRREFDAISREFVLHLGAEHAVGVRHGGGEAGVLRRQESVERVVPDAAHEVGASRRGAFDNLQARHARGGGAVAVILECVVAPVKAVDAGAVAPGHVVDLPLLHGAVLRHSAADGHLAVEGRYAAALHGGGDGVSETVVFLEVAALERGVAVGFHVHDSGEYAVGVSGAAQAHLGGVAVVLAQEAQRRGRCQALHDAGRAQIALRLGREHEGVGLYIIYVNAYG